MTAMDRKEHWEQVFHTKASTDVSWFQATPATSLQLLDAAGFTADT